MRFLYESCITCSWILCIKQVMSIATCHLVIHEQEVMCKMPLFDQGRGFILIHPGPDLSHTRPRDPFAK